MLLPGTPSDQAPDVLAEGDGAISTLFVSMATRHPDGTDAEYLRWHTTDHRPEQHRLAAVRASLRVVSTPECRAARAVSRAPYDAIDHVMCYFFAGVEGMEPFLALSKALGNAGRKLTLLPAVERGVYAVASRVAAPRVKVGADVMPWWPIRGVYLLLERGSAAPEPLVDIDGVVGVWAATSLEVPARLASAPAGQTLTYCFLDDDPVRVAERMAPVLRRRWHDSVEPLLAAPFHVVVPHDWERHVP